MTFVNFCNYSENMVQRIKDFVKVLLSSRGLILKENTSVLHSHPTLEKNNHQIWGSSNTRFKASSSDARKRAVYTSTDSIDFTGR